MNKFKFGQYKTARFLDHEATTMFYPVITTTFVDLAQGLIKDGHPDLALKALHKYDQEMPYLYIDIPSTGSKFYMAQTAYELHDLTLATKIVTGMDDYLTDQLNYMHSQLADNAYSVSARNIQMGVQMIRGLAAMATENHQTALSSKLLGQVKDYEAKFSSILNQQ
jgi:hypothetical protein